MVQEVIKVQSLSKSYNNKVVLNNVSFSVKKGTIHGFIGPNGAGKTTTLQIMVGWIKEQVSGEVYYTYWKDGKEEKRSVKHNSYFNENLGFIPAEPLFSRGTKVKEYVLDLAGLSLENWNSQREKEILNKLRSFLASLPTQQFSENQDCASLSTGQKKALQVFVLSVCRPQKEKILLLDEVFNGLDPSLRHDLFNNLKSIRDKGGTVLLSTHILSDLDKLADDITMIKQGNIVYTGPKTGDLDQTYEKYFIEKGRKGSFEL